MNHNNIVGAKLAHVLAIVILFTMAFTSCSQHEEGKATDKKEKTKGNSLATAPIQYINPEYELSLPAELKPYEQVAVYAKVTGFVKRLYVDRGEHVRKGQLLAVIEAPEMNQQYLSDKSAEQKMFNDYIYAKQAYDRLVEASATTGAVAAIELDRAKTAMESAKAAYQSSRAGAGHSSQLQQYLRITAPFNGIITERNVSVGALVGAPSGQPLFFVAQGSKLRLTIALPEKHAASVKKDMSATFTVSSQPGKNFNTSLSRTSGLLDQQDRSLTLEFDINNSSGELQGGDYALVKLKLQRRSPSYWVRNKSILRTQAGSFLLTLNNSEIKRISIKEGIRLDSLTEVFGKLSQQDKVLLKPSEEINEGKID